MTFDKNFKEAISQLSSAEKDKLIFRLLKKDLHFAGRLYFELVSTDSKEDMRERAQRDIESWVNTSRYRAEYSTP